MTRAHRKSAIAGLLVRYARHRHAAAPASRFLPEGFPYRDLMLLTDVCRVVLGSL